MNKIELMIISSSINPSPIINGEIQKKGNRTTTTNKKEIMDIESFKWHSIGARDHDIKTELKNHL